MGGIGSGRSWSGSGKDTTADYRRLDVRALHKAGLLQPGSSRWWQWSRNGQIRASIVVKAEAEHLTLSYTASQHGERKDYCYAVHLDWTPCRYGGLRPWFLCPGCRRRVAILYGGAVFACRHCYRLSYESQREAEHDRLARRADKIRARLGWEPGILNGAGWRKPKGMHWKTFSRLYAEHERLADAALAGMAQTLGLAGERFW